MNNTFLATNKSYFGSGLRAIDLLILSQVEEFHRNQCSCCLTNEQFSSMFGESLYAVKASLDRLENKKYITRSVEYIEGNGRSNKQRIIKLNHHEN